MICYLVKGRRQNKEKIISVLGTGKQILPSQNEKFSLIFCFIINLFFGFILIQKMGYDALICLN